MNVDAMVRNAEKMIARFDAAKATFDADPSSTNDIAKAYRKVEVMLGGSLFGIRELVKEYRDEQAKVVQNALVDDYTKYRNGELETFAPSEETVALIRPLWAVKSRADYLAKHTQPITP